MSSWRRTGGNRAAQGRWLAYLAAGGAATATLGPILVLVLLGFAAYRRSVAELDGKIEELSLTPAAAVLGANG